MRYAVIAGIVVLVLLASGYWVASGGRSLGEAPAWLTDRPFAHRGLHSPQAPENSLAAFEAAAAAGHPIELDVHLSSDGHVVVFHDDDLTRLAGDPRAISDVPLAELRQMRLLGTDQTIASLAEALELIDGRVPVLVEIKNRGEVGPLEDAVAEELSRYSGDVAVMSFNPFSLSRVESVAPHITRGQLSGTFEDEDLPAYQVFALRQLMMNWKSRPHFIAYEFEALPSWPTSLQRMRGRPLLAWTLDDPDSAEFAAGLADNLICDPGALLR